MVDLKEHWADWADKDVHFYEKVTSLNQWGDLMVTATKKAGAAAISLTVCMSIVYEVALVAHG